MTVRFRAQAIAVLKSGCAKHSNNPDQILVMPKLTFAKLRDSQSVVDRMQLGVRPFRALSFELRDIDEAPCFARRFGEFVSHAIWKQRA